jgi:hypothetical protein
MSTPSSFVLSNEAEILRSLTTQLGLENVIGADEEARHTSPEKIVWVPEPNGRSYQSPPTDESKAGKVIHLVSARYKVHLWGRDYNEVCDLEARLLKGLYTLLSPRNYELGACNPIGAETPSTNGYKFEIAVTLRRIPVFERAYSAQPVDTIAASGQTTQPDNSNPTPHGGTTVTY